MSRALTVQEIFAELETRMGLTWAAGQKGEMRTVESGETMRQRPSLVGYLNLIHPNKIQILGAEEIRYLDTLDARDRWETIASMMDLRPSALIVCDGLTVPEDIVEGAEETSTPLLSSANPSWELLGFLQYHIARALARSTTLHGVFMEVFTIGVLITGDSGSGKSELALELLTRGHRLIADDAPLFTQITPDILDGTCPPVLQDNLEVRGLGVLNVRAMFGDSAVKPNKYLRLIVHLRLAESYEPVDRLHGDSSLREILGVQIPVITVPVAPGRNLAVIVEAAVRDHILKMKGFDAAQSFLERHETHLRMDDKW